MEIVFRRQDLTPAEQSAVSNGFSEHSESVGAPAYSKQRLSWLATGPQSHILAALTADVLWDWLYIDELWVSPELRGTGLGRKLIKTVEDFAAAEGLRGIWLWTQSWQAEGFHRKMDYVEFTRFDDFPRGHYRVGLRKLLNSTSD